MKIPLPIEPWIRKDMTKKCLFFPLIVFVFHTQREVPDVDDALKFYFTDKLMEIRKLYALTAMTFPRCPSDTQFVFMSWIESCRVTFGLGCDAMHSFERLPSSASPAHQQLYQMIKCLIWSGEKCSCSLKLFYGYVPSAQPNTWHDSILLCLLHRIEFRFLNKLKISHYIFRYIEKRYVSQLQPHSLRWVPTYMVLNNNILIFWRIRDRSPSWIIISCRTRSGQWDKLSFIWECEWIVILFFPIKTLLLILILRLHPVRLICMYIFFMFLRKKKTETSVLIAKKELLI